MVTRWHRDEPGRPPRILTAPLEEEPLEELDAWSNDALSWPLCAGCGSRHRPGEACPPTGCLLCGGGTRETTTSGYTRIVDFDPDCEHVTRESIRERLRPDVEAKAKYSHPDIYDSRSETIWYSFEPSVGLADGCHPTREGAIKRVLDELVKREVERVRSARHAGTIQTDDDDERPIVAGDLVASVHTGWKGRVSKVRPDGGLDFGNGSDPALPSDFGHVEEPTPSPRAFEVGQRAEHVATPTLHGAVYEVTDRIVYFRNEATGIRYGYEPKHLRHLDPLPFKVGDVVVWPCIGPDDCNVVGVLVANPDGNEPYLMESDGWTCERPPQCCAGSIRHATPEERTTYLAAQEPEACEQCGSVIDGTGTAPLCLACSDEVGDRSAYARPFAVGDVVVYTWENDPPHPPMKITGPSVTPGRWVCSGWYPNPGTGTHADPADLRHATAAERAEYEG